MDEFLPSSVGQNAEGKEAPLGSKLKSQDFLHQPARRALVKKKKKPTQYH